MSSNSKTYSIYYGFSKSKLNAKGLREVLKKTGYDESDTLDTADIIIAHSGGCYLIPKKRCAKTNSTNWRTHE
jgi:hypothetical protein